ncbi:uncharacterized protein LOC132285887 [Cornus florida]|uniref:uncharacterized protein LOC132285887 n=1 Tax=Cornus florida TaxID=4283 RepID=UPI0028A08AAA|nr:uncharacterized protein LOC132285887 [Cornus florida]
MAFRSSNHWKSMVNRLRGSSSFATSTSPKMKAYAPADHFGLVHDIKTRPVRGDFVPVYVAIGMVILSTTLGMLTALHTLKYCPSVFVKKSRRETLPELVEPDHVVEEADKLIKKSFFRKVAHVQKEFRPVSSPSRIPSEATYLPESHH